MEPRDPEEPMSRKRKRPVPEIGPFVLRSLLEDLPLSADGDRDDIEINCVEFLGMCYGTPVFSLACNDVKLTMSRPEPLCWYICFRDSPLLPNSSRPPRCIFEALVYPSLKTPPSLSRASNFSASRCPADTPSPQSQQSLHIVQLDCYILLSARTQSSFWDNTNSTVQLDWWHRSQCRSAWSWPGWQKPCGDSIGVSEQEDKGHQNQRRPSRAQSKYKYIT